MPATRESHPLTFDTLDLCLELAAQVGEDATAVDPLHEAADELVAEGYTDRQVADMVADLAVEAGLVPYDD